MQRKAPLWIVAAVVVIVAVAAVVANRSHAASNHHSAADLGALMDKLPHVQHESLEAGALKKGGNWPAVFQLRCDGGYFYADGTDGITQAWVCADHASALAGAANLRTADPSNKAGIATNGNLLYRVSADQATTQLWTRLLNGTPVYGQ